MRLLLLSLLCTSVLAAQTDQEIGLADVVYRRAATELTGQVIRYDYGRSLDVVTLSGDTVTVNWVQLKRVNFRYDRDLLRVAKATERVRQRAAEPLAPEEEPHELKRPWRHHVSAGTLLGVTEFNNDFDFEPGRARILGIGLSYHFVYPVKRLVVGGGIDYALFSYARQESAIAVTGLVEYAFLNRSRRLSPYVRLSGGPALPISSPNSDNEIEDRDLGFAYTPSIGCALRPSRSNSTELSIDRGYRFLDSRFQLTTPTLDVLERNVAYRRVSLRGGIRF